MIKARRGHVDSIRRGELCDPTNGGQERGEASAVEPSGKPPVMKRAAISNRKKRSQRPAMSPEVNRELRKGLPPRAAASEE